jgi:2-keto-4-pentenoate hydratase
MNIDEAVEILWTSAQQGVHYPAALQGKLTPDEGYRVQLGVLARAVASGERQSGWKIGLTADSIRGMYGVSEPVFGYLLNGRHFTSGCSIRHADLSKPAIECELCFTLKETVQGPGVTSERVREAVGAVAPAFEIVDLRGNMGADLPLGVADNVSQWAYVTGTEVQPYPGDLDLGEVVVKVRRNGEMVMQGKGADLIDNQLQSLTWLANKLADYGVALQAGQCVMSGSFIKPTPVQPGDRWDTGFSRIGDVSATFN